MSRTVVSARGLGKRYRLDGGAPDRTLRETLRDFAAHPLRAFRRRAAEDFRALDDVSFDVARGEALGIIGPNGAGKSTLLKILSRVTAPSAGTVRLRGRVASLLEIGTGFHPELTGRENIFLNGAVLGMRRAEVRARFDEIVAFAEVEKFLDVPIKRYSSGMYVRLAFAVAAHVDAEILLVDEVLAVGDAAFQRKCLERLHGVASSGRTVFFVSHNLQTVARLCPRALLLTSGRLAKDGPTAEVIDAYAGGALGETPTEVDLERRGRAPGSDDARLLAARLRSAGLAGSLYDPRHALRVEVDFEILRDRMPVHPQVAVFADGGPCVFVSTDAHAPGSPRPRAPGRWRATLEVPANFFAEGWLTIDVALSSFEPFVTHCCERGLLSFHVSDPPDVARGRELGERGGVVRPLLPWTTEPLAVVTDLRSLTGGQ